MPARQSFEPSQEGWRALGHVPQVSSTVGAMTTQNWDSRSPR